MALTSKQNRFVQEYLVDHNATQAAIRAGYSEKTARAIASENLAKPDIRAAINRAQNKVAEKLELTVASVSARLCSIAEKAEKLDGAPGLNVARQAIMDAAKLNGLVVETQETILRSPEERALRLAALREERERIARIH
jgi:phage terminase small subunit